LVAVLFFGGTLLPALGFFNVFPMRYSFVADHFQYLASIGILTLIASAAWIALKRLRCAQWMAPAAGMALLVLGFLSVRQCQVYFNLETLWRDTIAKNPDGEMAHTNLGLLLQAQGRLPEA